MKVFIEGGHLPDESVWSPCADLIRGSDDNLFLKIRSNCKKFHELCGKSMGSSKLLQDLMAQRNEVCDAKLEEAIAAMDESQRANSLHMSRRSQQALVRLPEDVELHVGDVSLRVLCTLDHRHVIAVKLDSETLTNVVGCFRSSDARSSRSKRPRDEWITFTHTEVKWAYTRDSMYVMYSDDDGVVHRKFKKPFTVRPESDTVADEKISATADWLHQFFLDNHKGPMDVVLPAELFDDNADDEADECCDGGEHEAHDTVAETQVEAVVLPAQDTETVPDDALDSIDQYAPEPEPNPDE